MKRSKASKLTKGETPESGIAPINEFQELIGKLDKDAEESVKLTLMTPNVSHIGGEIPPSLVQQGVTLQKQSAEGLMSLLRLAGQAFVHLSSYESRASIEVLDSFSPNQKNTGWVLFHLAKAYFELADYKQAAKLFQEAVRVDPYHYNGW